MRSKQPQKQESYMLHIETCVRKFHLYATVRPYICVMQTFLAHAFSALRSGFVHDAAHPSSSQVCIHGKTFMHSNFFILAHLPTHASLFSTYSYKFSAVQHLIHTFAVAAATSTATITKYFALLTIPLLDLIVTLPCRL